LMIHIEQFNIKKYMYFRLFCKFA